MTEKEISKKILEYLNNQPGCFAFRSEQRPGMSRGCSDIIVVQCGEAIFIEVKKPGNKPTPLQLRFLSKAKAAGAFTLVACSVDDVKKALFPKEFYFPAPETERRP